MTPEELIAAEEQVVQLWRDGEVNALTHFCGSADGTYEEWLCDFWRAIKPSDYVCASHRCHYHWLLHHGGDIETLAKLVKSGKSMFAYGPRFICSAIVAGTAGIAAGLALAAQLGGTGERVWAFGGDGQEDQGSFAEAVWFVQERNLPCTFVIEDNNSSCGVSRLQRRGCDEDRVWPSCVIRYKYKPKYPHAGDGSRPNLKNQVQA